VALLVPQDLVWCRAGTDHAAVENVLLGCCAAAPGVASCRAGDPSPVDADGQATAGVDGEPCTDVPVGPFAGVVPSDAVKLPFVALLPAVRALAAAQSEPAVCSTLNRAAGLVQIHSPIHSTVLTI
jgi:hypothetical protein